MSLDPTIRQRIETLLAANPVVLFMKGTRRAPQCGFSAAAVGCLDDVLDDYATFDVLGDPDLRQGIKEFGQWPTIPQLYVGGELVGGADLVQSMYASGELFTLLGKPPPDRSPPAITISGAAAERIKAALADSGDDALFLVIDNGFHPRFEFRPQGEHDIVAMADGLEVRFDPASAKRARGASIDWTTTPHGEGLAIHLPEAPPTVKALDVHALAERIRDDNVTVIDVRGADERARASFTDAEVLDGDSYERLAALPKDTPLAFLCHHGERSREAAEHFRELGFRDVANVTGGIDAWAREVDAAVGRY